MPESSAAFAVLATSAASRPDTNICRTALMPPYSAAALTIETRTLPDAGAIQAQLMKLKPATAAQSSACHQRILNVSSNSARVNSQNTTMLPVDSAINGACQIETGVVAPMP